MEKTIHRSTLELTSGDITQQKVDALVNAANSRLAGGGGVDGAIHRRGGPSIMAETRRLYPQGCPTGSAVITGAGQLPAKYVIHAVGPVWHGGSSGEPELLAHAYQRSLELAVHHDCRSVALPALSTGAYRYPLDAAARVALTVADRFLRPLETPLVIRFVLWDETAMTAFSTALQQMPR